MSETADQVDLLERELECARRALAHARDVLRWREQLLKAVLDGGREGIFICDQTGTVVEASSAAVVILDRPRAEVIGGKLDRRLLPSARPSSPNLVSDKRSVWYRQQIRTRDGQLRELEICTRHDLAYRWSITIVRELRPGAPPDDPEQRQMQKLGAIGQLAVAIAHDLNNLLLPITACASSLLRARPAPSLREDCEQILAAANRASELTRQLLAFVRRSPLVMERVDANDLVARMELLLRRLIAPNIRLEVRLQARAALVHADTNLLEHALLNLAINAADAMPNGGTLTITTTDLRVAAADPPDGSPSGVELSVADTGTGMDAATLRRAFEPFFTTKAAGKGTGLGLPMVSDALHRMDGKLEVQSTPGQGTTVILLLRSSTPSVPTRA